MSSPKAIQWYHIAFQAALIWSDGPFNLHSYIDCYCAGHNSTAYDHKIIFAPEKKTYWLYFLLWKGLSGFNKQEHFLWSEAYCS
jgi:hypothetical protein